MPNARDIIAAQLARRRTGGVALPALPPLGASPAAMVAAVPTPGTPAHRPVGAMAEPNPFMAALNAVDRQDDAGWDAALRAISSRWKAPDPSDEQHDYIYGERVMGPR